MAALAFEDSIAIAVAVPEVLELACVINVLVAVCRGDDLGVDEDDDDAAPAREGTACSP